MQEIKPWMKMERWASLPWGKVKTWNFNDLIQQINARERTLGGGKREK